MKIRSIRFRGFIINDSNKFFGNLIKVIIEEKIEKIVIGYPLNFKSEKTIQTEAVENSDPSWNQD
ncbi:MAG: hypothetical protein R2942_11855 [Ignavibacteria bacterium]